MTSFITGRHSTCAIARKPLQKLRGCRCCWRVAGRFANGQDSRQSMQTIHHATTKPHECCFNECLDSLRSYHTCCSLTSMQMHICLSRCTKSAVSNDNRRSQLCNQGLTREMTAARLPCASWASCPASKRLLRAGRRCCCPAMPECQVPLPTPRSLPPLPPPFSKKKPPGSLPPAKHTGQQWAGFGFNPRQRRCYCLQKLHLCT